MVVGTAPVGDDGAVKAPGIPQDLLEQMGVLVGVSTVDQVVAGHDGLGMALGDGDLKVGEVEFPQGALIHHRVGGHAAQFLAVGGKMLGAGGNAVLLNAADVSGGHLARQVGVLREIFKVPSAQRAALGVQAGAQQYGNVLRSGFLAQRPADLLAQGRVPAAGNGRRRGEAGRRLTGIDAQMVALPCLLAHAVGAVRQPDRRDAVLRQSPRPESIRTGKQCTFLFQGQGFDLVFQAHLSQLTLS